MISCKTKLVYQCIYIIGTGLIDWLDGQIGDEDEDEGGMGRNTTLNKKSVSYMSNSLVNQVDFVRQLIVEGFQRYFARSLSDEEIAVYEEQIFQSSLMLKNEEVRKRMVEIFDEYHQMRVMRSNRKNQRSITNLTGGAGTQPVHSSMAHGLVYSPSQDNFH